MRRVASIWPADHVKVHSLLLTAHGDLVTDETKTEAESLLPYRRWSEDALREVVARALEEAASSGLPGEHHYYLTFRTDFPGVVMPRYLLARYPREMTIVLQHAFTDLFVDRTAHTFSVVLSFGGAPSGLVVPFSALTAFADPYAKFGLRFESTDPQNAEGSETLRPDGAAQLKPKPKARSARAGKSAAKSNAGAGLISETIVPSGSGQVVSLDAFRRRAAEAREGSSRVFEDLPSDV